MPPTSAATSPRRSRGGGSSKAPSRATADRSHRGTRSGSQVRSWRALPGSQSPRPDRHPQQTRDRCCGACRERWPPACGDRLLGGESAPAHDLAAGITERLGWQPPGRAVDERQRGPFVLRLRASARRGSARRASSARRRCRSSRRRSGSVSRAPSRSAAACRPRRRSGRSSGPRSARRRARGGARAGRARRGPARARRRGSPGPTWSPSPSRPEPLPISTRPSGVVRK